MAKRRTNPLTAVLPVLLALAACGTGESSTAPSAPGTAIPPARASEPTPLTPSPGFIAMPSAQQVVQAQPHGRIDPFAPVTAAPASTPSETPEADLQLTGLIGSGRSAQALVSLGGQSGTVCIGRQGLCPGSGLPALLPPGWTVTGIDLGRGQLRLNQAGQQRVLSL
ncbi:hypothetical protein [Synechococcus sp. NB0720_010]|uniref:hypothetical protein n=1 Tax=Synechococcus sp. NB0720_010 TaxID=2907159 RepID=UPI001FF710EB|nr:hypothetical protein [Synechococcus sp. NB0720_010]UPH89620.1 hypothetical protein LY254_10045 [Synechococcus sp. NB0720_010]